MKVLKTPSLLLILFGIVLATIITLFWDKIGARLVGHDYPLSDLYAIWSPLISVFAFGATLYTIVAQYDTLKEAAQDHKASALLDLSSEYNNPHYACLRAQSWNIMILSLNAPKYFAFFIDIFFATEYKGYGTMPEDTLDELFAQLEAHRSGLSKLPRDKEALIQWELEARHAVPDMMNFYSLLSHRLAGEESAANAEFYYDWWRPFFWRIADAVQDRYEALEPACKKNVSQPTWEATLTRLDTLHGLKTGKNRAERSKDYEDHPLIKRIKREAGGKAQATAPTQ